MDAAWQYLMYHCSPFLPSTGLQNVPIFIIFIYDREALNFLRQRHQVIGVLVTGKVFEL